MVSRPRTVGAISAISSAQALAWSTSRRNWSGSTRSEHQAWSMAAPRSPKSAAAGSRASARAIVTSRPVS